jgi:hypothetical protein
MNYRKTAYIICLVLFLPIISACSFWSSDKTTDNWENEILMAGACGEEGLMCCIDQDPVCKYGSCCVDPNDASKNYCSESCDFGKLDTFCRIGDDCDNGLACSNNYCVECGGVGQPCCADENCTDTLACFRDICVTCGLTDNPCCEEEPYCLDDDIDSLNRAECSQEICSLCGANGNKPCALEPRCNNNHLLNNDSCYRCGGFNQPCCQNITPEGTEKYCIENGLECKLDFCSK